MSTPLPEPVPDAHPVVHFLHRRLVMDGKTRLWLSEKSGLGRSTLWGWWNAKRDPNIREVDRALDALDCSAFYMTKLSGRSL